MVELWREYTFGDASIATGEANIASNEVNPPKLAYGKTWFKIAFDEANSFIGLKPTSAPVATFYKAKTSASARLNQSLRRGSSDAYGEATILPSSPSIV